jgi:hypothetical protein
MKLGIVVVYLIKKENEGFLDLHLRQIERYTAVSYTINGSVNRPLTELRAKVECHPKVIISRCPTTSLRGDDEQVYYLDHLIGEAIEDGASHIVTLHVDLFPIRSGWAEALAGKLTESRLFAVPYHGNYTAYLFFRRDFYLKYRPTFRLSEAVLSSKKYWEFCRQFDHIPHAGVGYFFKAYTEGLSWYPLTESNIGNAHFVFIGIISLSKTQQKLVRAKKLIIPRRLLSWGWRYIGFPVFCRPIHCHVKEELLENPDSSLNFLRTGQRQK